MKDFFIGLLTVNALFALCFGISLVYFKLSEGLRSAKRPPDKPQKEKIYYISERPERKRKQKRSPPIAVKGTLLTDEQLKKLLDK